MSRRESPFHLDVAGATHLGGKRAHEDHHGHDEQIGLLAVASGVSTRPAGRNAAEAAIEALFDYLTDPNVTPPAEARERMARAFAHVHRRVRERAAADDHLRGMATSLSCAMEKGRLLLVGHVGDTRLIRVREGRLERLATVHRRGTDRLVLSRSPAAAVEHDQRDTLTRAIGLSETIAPEVSVETLHGNDAVLVCTHGLTAALDDRTILDTVHRFRSPRAIVDELIQRARSEGAMENITAVYGHWRQIGV